MSELKNLGKSPSDNPMKVGSRLIFVPRLGLDGAPNIFDNVAAVTSAAIIAKLNAASKLDRIYPLPEIENVESVKGESIYHEFNSGKKKYVRESVKHFVGYFPNEQPQFLEKIKGWLSEDFGVYIVDIAGNFIYMTDSATKLKIQPFDVDGESFSATEIEATDKEVNMVKIEFDYKLSVKDELKRFIAPTDLDFDPLSSTDLYSLLDVSGVSSGEALTGFDLKLTTDYGTPVLGLEAADFTAVEDDGTPVTITSVTGASDGTYTFVVSGLLGSETVLVTPSKERYDFAKVSALEIAIPSS